MVVTRSGNHRGFLGSSNKDEAPIIVWNPGRIFTTSFPTGWWSRKRGNTGGEESEIAGRDGDERWFGLIGQILVEYPYPLGRDTDFREHAIQNTAGTSGRQRVQVNALTPYLLPCPTVGFWAKFSSLVSPMFGNIEATRKESRTLASLRHALLPKLIFGELRIKAEKQLIERAV